MFCSKCGASVPDGVQFCGSCGNKMPSGGVGTSAPRQIASPPGGVSATPRGGVPADASAVSASRTSVLGSVASGLNTSRIFLFVSIALTVALIVFALVAFVGSIGVVSEELASYPQAQAALLALLCGVSTGAFLVFLASAASIFASRLFAPQTERPKGSPLAVLFLVLALVLCIAAFVAGFLFSNSAVSDLRAAFYLMSVSYAGMQPVAVVLCVCAIVSSLIFASASKGVSK